MSKRESDEFLISYFIFLTCVKLTQIIMYFSVPCIIYLNYKNGNGLDGCSMSPFCVSLWFPYSDSFRFM